MSDISKISVGISAGDPNGIGIEIILKAFQDKRLFTFFTPVVFANSDNAVKMDRVLFANIEPKEIRKFSQNKPIIEQRFLLYLSYDLLLSFHQINELNDQHDLQCTLHE